MSILSGAGELQFQRAEFTDRKCTLCNSTIGDIFFQVQGSDACPACAQMRLASQSATGSRGKTFRALLWGGGAAIAGSAAFAAVAFMGFQLAILSIGIGWLVGTAIKKGTGGYTSRKYQVMAVLLTYLAIATSYVPLIVAQVAKKIQTKKAQGEAVAPPTVAPEKPMIAPPKNGFLLAIMIAALVLAIPLIDAFASMPGGILTLLIVFFGLQQAWRQTRPDNAVIAGPFPNAGYSQ